MHSKQQYREIKNILDNAMNDGEYNCGMIIIKEKKKLHKLYNWKNIFVKKDSIKYNLLEYIAEE